MICWICDLIFGATILKQFSSVMVTSSFWHFFVVTKNVCFLCDLCGNVTIFFSFSPKYTVQNPLWNKQIYTKFINVLIENNLSHRSGAESTLCNVAIKISLLLLQIFIRTCSFCFSVTWCKYSTSIFLSLST